MAQTYVGQKRIRRMFGKIREVLEMPNLIEVQKSSYDLFLRSGDSDTPLDGEGLMGTFQSVFRSRISTRRRFWSSSSTIWKSRNTISRNARAAT